MFKDRAVSAIKLRKSKHLGHEKVYGDLYWLEIKKGWDESARRLMGQTKSKL
jgi:hypothetical protein